MFVTEENTAGVDAKYLIPVINIFRRTEPISGISSSKLLTDVGNWFHWNKDCCVCDHLRHTDTMAMNQLRF
jgi:hypothetical protein